jgi:hypothetical protein
MFKSKPGLFILLLLSLSWCGRDGVRASGVSTGAPAPTAIVTGHIDQTRRSWNNSEALLSPAIVTGGNFKKRASLSVSGFIFSQPLIVPGILIGGAQKDLLIATTMNGNVYAFDANNYGAALWTAAIGNPMTSYPQSGVGNAYYQQPLGCVSTPVADIPNNKLYVVCGDQTAPSWILHVLKLTDGTSLGSVTLTGSVTGTGDPTGGDKVSGGILTFYPFFSVCRSALALANGIIYIAFSGEEDQHPWHGWVFAYNASTLSRVGVWCATPNNYGGSVWMSSGGPAVDSAGNIYVTTGNGVYDGSTNFADSVVKLSGSNLAKLDWFTSSDYANNESADADTSSGRPMLISSNRLLVASKNFFAYVLDIGCMGHLQGSGSGCALQTWVTNGSGVPGASSGTYGGLFGLASAYLNTATGSADSYAYSVSGGTFNTTPFITSAVSTPSATVSSNAGSNGIVWVVTYTGSPYSTPRNGTLRALNPATFAEYWNSDTSGTDTLGTMAKWCSPVVANGHVYVPNNGSQVVVYAAF